MLQCAKRVRLYRMVGVSPLAFDERATGLGTQFVAEANAVSIVGDELFLVQLP